MEVKVEVYLVLVDWIAILLHLVKTMMYSKRNEDCRIPLHDVPSRNFISDSCFDTI